MHCILAESTVLDSLLKYKESVICVLREHIWLWLSNECILCLGRLSGHKYVGIFFSVMCVFKGTNLAVW